MMLFGKAVYLPTEGLTVSGFKDRKAEDSLENTFSCVPKVQGESRISQAKGQSCLYDRQICALDSPRRIVEFLFREKEGLYYVRKTH